MGFTWRQWSVIPIPSIRGPCTTRWSIRLRRRSIRWVFPSCVSIFAVWAQAKELTIMGAGRKMTFALPWTM